MHAFNDDYSFGFDCPAFLFNYTANGEIDIHGLGTCKPIFVNRPIGKLLLVGGLFGKTKVLFAINSTEPDAMYLKINNQWTLRSKSAIPGARMFNSAYLKRFR
jgi:hypothetical protein